MSSKSITTWQQAADYTWTHCWSRQKSARTVEKRVERITKFCGKSFPLRKMGETWWWHELMTDILNEDNVSNATVNRAVSVATHALKFTKKAGLHSVKCPEFDRLPEDECRQSWYTKEQVDRLAFLAVDIFDRKDLSDAILFAAYTGCRQGELLKIKSTGKADQFQSMQRLSQLLKTVYLILTYLVMIGITKISFIQRSKRLENWQILTRPIVGIR